MAIAIISFLAGAALVGPVMYAAGQLDSMKWVARLYQGDGQ